MSGWLYLIKNRDIYKIGITKNFESRMRQLKPDQVIAKLYSSDYKQLERELHKRYKDVRIPQSEYFRLDKIQIRDIKLRISNLHYSRIINFWIFLKALCILLLIFPIVFLTVSLTISDINNIIFISLNWMERISFCLSFISLFIGSNNSLDIFNELQFRVSRICIFCMFALIFKVSSRLLF